MWAASTDPLMDCKACKTRHRADKLIEDYTKGAETADGWSNARRWRPTSHEHDIVCPDCGSRISPTSVSST